MSLAWDEIMQHSPTMKKLIEDKITSEITPLQEQIDQLKTENDQLKALVQPQTTTSTT